MLPPGHILAGKYRVERVIGEGGFGVVLEATHLVLGGQVAIKILKPELANDEAIVSRFLREARSAARIRGEHGARVLDVGSGPGQPPYIVMEHLRGNDLAKVVATRGSLPVALAIDHIVQACAVIAEAHSLGIVHRDIKPSNLFLTTRPDGTSSIKVLDFGIAKAVPSPDAAPSITQTQDVVGTPLYMAPEQMRSAKVVDPRTDVWALGATLYELITGTPAFEGESISEIYARVLTDAPRPLPSHVPGPVAAAVMRCLEKRAEGRFPDVGSFVAAIAPFGSARNLSSPALTGAIHITPPAQPAPTPGMVFNDTLAAQQRTQPFAQFTTRPRRGARAAVVALLAFVALGAALALPRVRAVAASTAVAEPPPPAQVEAPVVVAEAPTPAPHTVESEPARPAPSAKPRGTGKARRAPEAKSDPKAEPKPEPKEPEPVVAPPAATPRGVATSRFE